jgi:adenylate cyclase
MTPTPEQSRVDEALRAYEQRSLPRITAARSLTFAIILAWVWINYGAAVGLEYAPVLLGFIALGLAAWQVRSRHPDRAWLAYLFVALDVLLLTWALAAPGGTYPQGWPWQAMLRQPNYMYFLVIPALATLSFRPLLVLWAGACAVVSWTLATVWIATRPGTLVGMGDLMVSPDASDAEMLARYLDPAYVEPDDAAVRAFVTLILSGILALVAHRARMLIRQEAEAARLHANLSRYVAPSMVERLSRLDRPMSAVRNQNAAVLFADIRGFTTLAESMTPEATMALLRDYHGRMAAIVFRHGGTLDKFIGDGLMATFGTPEVADDDAARAVACGHAMLAEVDRWNGERRAQSLATLAIGIGIHYGPVTTGDIGGAMRFEFAVIGDTVNVASRLEEMTAKLGRAMLVSDATLAAAGAAADASAFDRLGPIELRGRQETTVAWSPRG